jgi:hypothetical protein
MSCIYRTCIHINQGRGFRKDQGRHLSEVDEDRYICSQSGWIVELVQSNQSILFSFSCGGVPDLVREVNTGDAAAELKGMNLNYLNLNQCCGSMTFWCGSGSGSAPLTNGSGSLTFKMPTKKQI